MGVVDIREAFSLIQIDLYDLRISQDFFWEGVNMDC